MTGNQHRSADPPGSDGAEPGIMGNLPRSRPSVRSPRRPDRPAEPAEEAAAPGTEGSTLGGRQAEVEALVKAGASLAGSAAMLGLRAAGRAATALRDAVELR